MTFAFFDDDAPTHPKIACLSDAAYRLWSESILWSSRHLTDGKVPGNVPLETITRARNPKRAVGELVATGLWETNGSGWYIHDYTEHQRTRADAEAFSAAQSERGKKGAAARWHKP